MTYLNYCTDLTIEEKSKMDEKTKSSRKQLCKVFMKCSPAFLAFFFIYLIQKKSAIAFVGAELISSPISRKSVQDDLPGHESDLTNFCLVQTGFVSLFCFLIVFTNGVTDATLMPAKKLWFGWYYWALETVIITRNQRIFDYAVEATRHGMKYLWKQRGQCIKCDKNELEKEVIGVSLLFSYFISRAFPAAGRTNL